MRITFVLKHANMSGGDRVVAAHAMELQRRGHDITVVSTPWPHLSARDRIRQILRRDAFRRPVGIVPSPYQGTGLTHLITESTRPIEDADVPDGDVVIATFWETARWVAALSPAKGAKVYFIQHYETWAASPEDVDATWRLPMHKIVISKWLAELARDKFGEQNVWHVPNSVDRKQFNAPPRGKQPIPTVGMLYSTMSFKGCDVALRAFEQVRRNLPQTRLISFGTHAPERDLPLPPGSSYTVQPPQDKIRDLYGQCDVWLCGSRAEGFHLPPLEAMACRCPVVSTKVGGPMDIVVQGENGFLVDVGDRAALADRVTAVLQLSEASWRQMSDAAYATACRYSWRDAGALMEKALEAAINRRGSAQKIGA